MRDKELKLFTFKLSSKRTVTALGETEEEALSCAALKSFEKVRKIIPIKGLSKVLNLLWDGTPKEADILSTFPKVAQLLRVSIPLSQTLRLQLPSVKRIRSRRILLKIASSIEEGRGLADAFSVYEEVFSKSTLAMLRSAEASGDVACVLAKMGDALKKRILFIKKLKGELIYPKIVMTVGSCVMLFFIFFLIPKLKEVYDNFDENLPFVTGKLYAFSQAFKEQPALVLVPIFFLVVLIQKRKKLFESRSFEVICYKIPRLGRFLFTKDFVLSMEYLVLLLGSGVSFREGIREVVELTKSYRLKRAFGQVSESVCEGQSLEESFLKVSQELGDSGDELANLFEIAERSGELTPTLATYVGDASASLDAELDQFKQWMTPIITIFMGVVGFCIVSTVIYPLIRLNTLFLEQ